MRRSSTRRVPFPFISGERLHVYSTNRPGGVAHRGRRCYNRAGGEVFLARTDVDFSRGSIPKTILRLSLPMIAAQIINALYSMVDRMFIGRIPEVGSQALTGVGVTFPFIMIISAFAALAGMGGAPLLSIARGEGRDEYGAQIIGNACTMLLVFGVALTVICLAVKDPVLYWFGASEETMPYADAYLSVYALGSLFVMATLGMNCFISAQGFARVSMMTVLIGAVLNIILDPIFIFVLHMGVQGAALATIISQGVSAVWVMKFLTCDRCTVRLQARHMRPDGPVMRRILGLGLSTFVMNVNDSLVSIVCNTSLQAFGGDVYVGVMTVVSSVRSMLTMPLSGFSQAASPVIGYNYGAGRYDRVRQAAMFTLCGCMGFATLVWIITLSVPEWLIRIFNDDPALIAAGVPCCRIYFALFLLMGLQLTGQRCFVALGKSRQAIFFSLLRKAFLVVPLALTLPRLFNLGVYGVFLAEPISDFIGPVACFTTFMLTEWKHLRQGEKAAA